MNLKYKKVLSDKGFTATTVSKGLKNKIAELEAVHTAYTSLDKDLKNDRIADDDVDAATAERDEMLEAMEILDGQLCQKIEKYAENADKYKEQMAELHRKKTEKKSAAPAKPEPKAKATQPAATVEETTPEPPAHTVVITPAPPAVEPVNETPATQVEPVVKPVAASEKVEPTPAPVVEETPVVVAEEGAALDSDKKKNNEVWGWVLFGGIALLTFGAVQMQNRR